MAGEKKKREAGVASKPSLEMAFDPIGAALRQIHHNIAAEVIPEEFLRLLDKLSDTGAKRSPK